MSQDVQPLIKLGAIAVQVLQTALEQHIQEEPHLLQIHNSKDQATILMAKGIQCTEGERQQTTAKKLTIQTIKITQPHIDELQILQGTTKHIPQLHLHIIEVHHLIAEVQVEVAVTLVEEDLQEEHLEEVKDDN